MKPLRIAQISDFHYTNLTLNPFRLFSKRLLGLLNWLVFRKGGFSTLQLEALPPLLQKLALDKILLAGDFTTTALPSEFSQAAAFVRSLPAPWIAVPGNHDLYTYRSQRKKHFYKALAHPRPQVRDKTGFFSLEEQGVEAERLADHWWIVSLDTARATNLYSSQGLFSEKQEGYLTELLSLIPQDHSMIMLTHYPFLQVDAPRRSLERGEALEKILRRDARIKAYLHGHTHRHIIADLQASGLPVVLDGGCSANEKRGSWNLLTIHDQGMQIDVYRWKKGWVVDQTEMITWRR